MICPRGLFLKRIKERQKGCLSAPQQLSPRPSDLSDHNALREQFEVEADDLATNYDYALVIVDDSHGKLFLKL